jgi:hypothetical protein
MAMMGGAPDSAEMTDVAFVPLQFVQVPADCPHVHPPTIVMFAGSATCSLYVPWSR